VQIAGTPGIPVAMTYPRGARIAGVRNGAISMSRQEIGQELFGSDEQVVRQSTINIADECKAAGLLTVPIDYQEVYVTPEGMRFIGKSQGDA